VGQRGPQASGKRQKEMSQKLTVPIQSRDRVEAKARNLSEHGHDPDGLGSDPKNEENYVYREKGQRGEEHRTGRGEEQEVGKAYQVIQLK